MKPRGPRRRKPRSSTARATIALTIFFIVVVALSLANPNLASSSPLLPASEAYRILSHEPRQRLESLAKLTDDAEGGKQLTRPFLGRAHSLAADEIARWFDDAGLENVKIDAVGNVRGEWSVGGEEEGGGQEEVLLIGSHYDTVRNAGAFDGALGIVAAAAAVKAAAEARRVAAVAAGGGKTPTERKRTIELVAFSDEEGLRFGTTFLGSSALAGTLLGSGVLDVAVDSERVTLRAALLDLKKRERRRTTTTSTLEEDVAACALHNSPSRRYYRGYVEVHMEQGPTLESENARMSVVSSISGQTRMLVKVLGSAGHAGTVPMGKKRRRDAAVGAAEVVIEVERICEGMSGVSRRESSSCRFLVAPLTAAARAARAAVGGGNSSSSPLLLLVRRIFSPLRPAFETISSSFLSCFYDSRPDHLVCTVGKISISPNAPNVVAGSAELVVDVRSSSDDAKRAALSAIERAVSDSCSKRSLQCSSEVVHEAKGSKADAALSLAVEGAAKRSESLFSEMMMTATSKDDDDGFDSNDTAAVTHVARARASGAGHDALALSSSDSQLPLPWAMLFVRDVGGVSHSPLEKVRDEDVAAACAALYEVVVEHVGL